MCDACLILDGVSTALERRDETPVPLPLRRALLSRFGVWVYSHLDVASYFDGVHGNWFLQRLEAVWQAKQH